MLDEDYLASTCEFKTASDATGDIEGHASVFNLRDTHRDIVLPGAFTETLAERKNRPLAMHINHGLPKFGGVPNVGNWRVLTEDSKGLEVKGRIAALNTDQGRYNYERVREGVFTGLSIGYRVPPGGGARIGGERKISKLSLFEASIVDDPSNFLSLIREVKAAEQRELKVTAQPMQAATSIAAAIALHQASLRGNDAPTAQERADMLAHLQDAHEALTGQRMPAEMKSDLVGLMSEMAEVKRLLAVMTSTTRHSPDELITAASLGWG